MVRSLQQGLAACFCCGRRGRGQALDSAEWRDAPAPGVAGDVPPLLDDAGAKQAAAALSAAMDSKLAAAAALASSGNAAGKQQPASGGDAAADASQPGGLIKAALPGEAAADGASPVPPPLAAEASEEPAQQFGHECRRPFGHVDSLVQHFKRLSPRKLPDGEAGAATPLPTAPSPEPHAPPEPSQRRPLPQRSESRRAFLRNMSRHPRFAGVPEEGEEESSSSPASNLTSPVLTGSGSGSGHGSPLLGSQPTASASAKSTVRPSSRLSGRTDLSSEAALAAELRDTDSAADISGASGNSRSSCEWDQTRGVCIAASRSLQPAWCTLS